MKKNIKLFMISLLMVAFVGCEKDIINLVDPSGSSENGDEDISYNDFGIDVWVVFSTTGAATVTGANGSDFEVTINNNDVTIVYTGDTLVMYTLTGTTTDGFFKLYSTRKHGITLSDVSITHNNGAAINVQGTKTEPSKGKSTYMVLNGTNSLTDGASYTETPANEDEKAALFSEGQIIFSGNGSLTVTAKGKSGITSDDYIRVLAGPTLNVTSTAGHGIRGKDYILVEGGDIDVTVSANMKKGLTSDGYVQFDGGNTTVKVSGNAAYDSEDQEYTGTAGVKADSLFRMNGGVLTITNSGTGGKGISCDGPGYFNGGMVDVTTTGNNYTSGDVSAKGIKFDGALLFAGSTVSVHCSAHEGIESKSTITITDGVVYSYAKNDAMNAAGNFTISGGYVCGHSTSNDGLDANGNFYIQGGFVYAIGSRNPEVAIDANTEGGYRLYVSGGTIVAIGGLERNSSLTQSCYSTNSWSKNTWYSMTVGNDTYAFKTASSGGTQLVVSGATKPVLKSNATVSGGTNYFNNTFILNPTMSGGTTVNLSNYTGGGGPGGW